MHFLNYNIYIFFGCFEAKPQKKKNFYLVARKF